MNRIHKYSTLLTASIFLISLSLVAVNTRNGKSYEVGDDVKNFTLTNVNGKKVSLSDFRDQKGVIIIFWSSLCPACKAYESRVIALDSKYSSLGFPVMAIQSNDTIYPGNSFRDMVQLAKEKDFRFRYVHDKTQDVGRAFGATNTPQVFLLKNQGGGFEVAYIGSIDDSGRASQVQHRYVEDAIEDLLANREVAVKKTKAIGCTIGIKK